MALLGNGTSGWVAGNFGVEAELSPGYTMMIWMRVPTGSSNAGLVWGGISFVHTAIYATTGPDGYFADEVDNAFTDLTPTVHQTQSSTWVPVIYSKGSQSQATLYVGPTPTFSILSGTLAAQTLTALYLGQDETGAGVLASNQSLAEAAVWSGPLGAAEIGQLMAGASALAVQPGRLLCYFPLRNNLQDYGPRSLSLRGPAPVFTDHPPVANFADTIQLDGIPSINPPIVGTLNLTTGPATIVGQANPIAVGRLNSTTGAATLVGVASNGNVSGRLNLATGAATLAAAGSVQVVGQLHTTAGAATLTAAGQVNTPSPTTDTSVITVDAITPQLVNTTWKVDGSYTLYPTLQFADDSSTNYTTITTSVAPLGTTTFAFIHPAMPAGQHTLLITDPSTTDTGSTSYIVDNAGNITPTSAFPPTQPALTGIIPAYAYQEYNDDDDINAFFTAYNNEAQTYLNWFNAIQLPVYTGPMIAGSLLDWVAQGLYGIARPSLSTSQSSTIGEFNTYALNSIEMDAGGLNSEIQTYVVTDDIFKRIITWSFYKADGKIFSSRWLKRRIARFLAGVNGTDYSGPTYQISVTFPSPNVMAIAITNGIIETTYAPVLKAGLLSGVLPIPFRYSITVSTP